MAASESINPHQMHEHLRRAAKHFGGEFRGDHIEFPSGEEGGRPLRVGVSTIHFTKEVNGSLDTSIGLADEGPVGSLNYFERHVGSRNNGAIMPLVGSLVIDHGHDVTSMLDDANGRFPIEQRVDSEERTSVPAEHLRDLMSKSHNAIVGAREAVDSGEIIGWRDRPTVRSSHLKDPRDPSKGMRTDTKRGIVKASSEAPGDRPPGRSRWEDADYQYNSKEDRFDPI